MTATIEIPGPMQFWGKTIHGQPGISVRDHCLDVGSVARGLVTRLPWAANFSFPGAVTLASMHDVGKICPGFEAKCEAWIIQPTAWNKRL